MSQLVSASQALVPHYFRPLDHEDAYALVFVPKAVTQVRGERTVRCEVFAFAGHNDLAAGTPSEHMEDVAVNKGTLAHQLARVLEVGGVLAGYLDRGEETYHGTAPWIIADLEEQKDVDLVAAFLEQRSRT